MKKYREPIETAIDSLSADGCGVSADGRLAVYGSLPGEKVKALPLTRKRGKLFLKAIDVHDESPSRVLPECEAALSCGGCSFQHLDHPAQLDFKAGLLAEQLVPLEPESWLPPLTGPLFGYRTKARLGVKFVEKKGRVLVGFREKQKPYITEISCCPVLADPCADLIEPLKDLVGSLSVSRSIPQIEIAAGDVETVLVFRHLEALTSDDESKLCSFGEHHGLRVCLQPGGAESVHRIFPIDGADLLSYSLRAFSPENSGLRFEFAPMDFTQVNLAVNRQMVDLAVELLDPGPSDVILDAFCGIGNFSLAVAGSAGEVIGAEQSAASIERARYNAAINGIDNASFEVVDLHDESAEIGGFSGINKVLLDPPRSGAESLMKKLESQDVERVVYVSCNPETLARDVKFLVQRGYLLRSAGIIDMFPHTTHVESIALLTRHQSGGTSA